MFDYFMIFETKFKTHEMLFLILENAKQDRNGRR